MPYLSLGKIYIGLGKTGKKVSLMGIANVQSYLFSAKAWKR